MISLAILLENFIDKFHSCSGHEYAPDENDREHQALVEESTDMGIILLVGLVIEIVLVFACLREKSRSLDFFLFLLQSILILH